MTRMRMENPDRTDICLKRERCQSRLDAGAQNRAPLSAKRHADANLTCPSRHRVRLHTIKPDNGETERESAKDREHRRACAHNPKLEVVVEMLRESLQGEDWECRIDLAHSTSQQIGCGCFTSGSE